MKTTKLYKLLLLLPFFLSLSSIASDSLKVKKTEYYEDGKLVRATFFDTLGRITKQIYTHFRVGFDAFEQNELTIAKFKDGELDSYWTYNVNFYGDSVLFYNKSDLGKLFKVKLSNGKKINEDQYSLIFKDASIDRMYLIESLDKFVTEKWLEARVKFNYDKVGNNVKQKSIEYSAISKVIDRQYDKKNRMVRSEYLDIGRSSRQKTIFIYSEKE